MKRKVHTESEMVKAVQELESGMEVSQVRRLKELEEENRTLHDVRELTEAWMTDYNECRPHESLDNMTPMEYREKKKVG